MIAKETIKYFLRKYFGYDIRSRKITVEDDFLDQKKLLADKPVKIIFDVGANVGQTTSKYKKIFPDAEIYGFEPFQETFSQYSSHFRGDKRIHPVNQALSENTGSATFFVNNNHYTNSLLSINKEVKMMKSFETLKKVETKTTTIDEFCSSKKISYIDVLKMDVQGGEMLVLKGATEMLYKKAIRLIYTEIAFVGLYHNQPLFDDIKKYLAEYDYVAHKTYNLSHDETGSPTTGDAIFIHSETTN